MGKNNIWLDISTSMRWTGGVVGIVRAQLEIAAAINTLFPEVRFSMFKDGAFIELDKRDLPWLKGEGSVAERYFEVRSRNNNTTTATPEIQPAIQRIEETLDKLAGQMPSRIRRIQQAMLLLVSALPYRLQWFGLVVTWLPRKTLGLVFRINQKLIQLGLRRMPATTSPITQSAKKFTYPYRPGDMVFSSGWMDDGKEPYYARMKELSPDIALSYMVYDTILIGETTRHLYPAALGERFETYFRWISEHCDLMLYGGKSPQRDGIRIQKQLGWPVPESAAIPYGGTDLITADSSADDAGRLLRLGITGPFIMSVGTIEIRKNHDTLYKAYVSLLEREAPNIPQLVFCGRPGWRSADLIDTINRDPRVMGKLLIVSPTDEELDTLYRHCLFTLLPTVYEGWALPLTEGLSHGKFCLASNIEPLREIGLDFPEYISPCDVMSWARKIEFFSNNANALQEREVYISKNWQAPSWEQCGKNVLNALQSFMTKRAATPHTPIGSTGKVWFDLSLSYGVWRGGITGIVRTELILAHHLQRIVPRITFFGFHEGHFYVIPNDRLIWLFESDDVSAGYTKFQRFWDQVEEQGTGHRIPIDREDNHHPTVPPGLPPNIPALAHVGSPTMTPKIRIKTAAAYIISALPVSLKKYAIKLAQKMGKVAEPAQNNTSNATLPQQRDLVREFEQELNGTAQQLPFKQNDMVFSAGVSWDQRPLIEIIKAKRAAPFYYTQLVYDLTPLNTPHLHPKMAYDWYEKFFCLAGIASDKIIYGGETAMLDGQKWQRDHHWPVTPGLPLKLGANIAPQIDHAQDQKILHELGITGSFILTVGTLEIRKNHETLYKAYLKLLEDKMPNIPQMVFVGGPGWKAQDTFDVISQDTRVAGKILLLRTTDQQLDVLYRHCLFTLLASLYEGWSLTLPESLGYNKFCLTSDVQPLREIGRDFVDYIHPWDVVGWADKIKFYTDNPKELHKREEQIRNQWAPITWEDCARQLTAYFKMINNAWDERHE